jgi:hypothetical protein
VAAGGASPYTWSIASSSATSAATLSNYGLNLGSSTTLNNSITGNVSSAAVTSTTTLSITVQVEDHNSVIATQTYSLTLYPQFQLTPSLPSVTESATVNTGQETVTASGGSGNYSFTTVTPPTGMSDSISGNVVSFTGTAPSTSGHYPLTVEVKDSTTGVTIGSTNDYSLTVNPPGTTISGNISLNNACGGVNLPAVTVTLSQGVTQIAQTTTSNGSYSFSGIAAGNYTITPSYTGTGIESLFYPLSQSITASGTPLSNENFNASIAYTVSGTVAYTHGSTTQTGQTYLVLNNNNCGGNGAPGTSITDATLTGSGDFSIRGVPPGSYTLDAWLDPLGQGVANVNDPTGNTTVTVSNANVTNAAVVITNPTFSTPTSNPQIEVVPNAGGVTVENSVPTNNNGVEDANEYIVQWSTSPTLASGSGSSFATVAKSHIFPATGTSSNVWILNNTVVGSGTFVTGTTYYFQAQAVNTLASPTNSSTWQTYASSGTPIGVTIGPQSCTGTCTAVSGAVTIPAGITIDTGAPLYVGMYQSSGSGAPVIAATEITSPVVGANSFTINVPSGSGWVLFGILDQNNDGEIDANDVTNTRNNNSSGITVSGSTMTGQALTLPSTNSAVTVQTQYNSTTSSGGSSTSYQLNLDLSEQNMLPVAATLTSGPNLLEPLDLASCNTCGHTQFQYSATLPGGAPTVGDAYDFTVTYSDGTVETGSTVNGAVTGWNGGSTLVGTADLPTLISPSVTSSTTPNFSWSVPAVDDSDVFQFQLQDNSITNGNNTIWQVPSNNSNSNGLTSSTTSLTWDVDPTDSTNKSTETTLNPSNTYSWSIEAKDSNGNQATTQTWFQP